MRKNRSRSIVIGMHLFFSFCLIIISSLRVIMSLFSNQYGLSETGKLLSMTMLLTGLLLTGLLFIPAIKQFMNRNAANILSMQLSIILSIFLVEFVFQFHFPYFPSFMGPDAETGWSPRPDVEGSYEYPGMKRVTLFTDHYGLPYGLVGKGARLTAIVGDSMLFPHSGYDDSPPKIFERYVTGKSRFINLAVGGYGTDQELLRLKRFIELFPDITDVIFFFYPLNDFDNNVWKISKSNLGVLSKPYFEFSSPETNDLVLRLPGPNPPHLFEQTTCFSYIGTYRAWAVFRNNLDRRQASSFNENNAIPDTKTSCFFQMYLTEPNMYFQDAQKLTSMLLTAIRDVCRSKRVKLHVFAIDSPTYLHFLDDCEFPATRGGIEAMKQNCAKTFHDAAIPFTWIFLEPAHLIENNIHPNNQGNRFIADSVMPIVQRTWD